MDELDTLQGDEMSEDFEEFEAFCSQLRRNAVAHYGNYDEFVISNDGLALQLAGSLMNNQSLHSMYLAVCPVGLTNMGTHALGKAVQSSAIRTLTVRIEEENEPLTLAASNRMRQFYECGIQKIQDLELSYFLTNRDFIQLGYLLRGQFVLSRLCLSALGNVTVAGVPKFAENLLQTDVKTLELSFASTEVCKALLINGIMAFPCLRSIEINNHSFSFFDKLDDSFRDWSVFGNLPAESVLDSLLLRASSLEIVKLNKCYLSNRDVMLLSTALMGNESLTELELDVNNISDEGARYLAESCKTWLQLEALDLSSNRIGAAGFWGLLSAASSLSSLESIHLSNNPLIGREGLSSSHMDDDSMEIESRLPHTISLVSCELTDKDVRLLLSQCIQKLQSLTLNGNKIGDDGAAFIANLLNNGLQLEELHLSDNSISALGVKMLIKASWTDYAIESLVVSGAFFGYQGLAMVAQDLPRSKLSRLILCNATGCNLKEDASKSPNANIEERNVAAQELVNAVRANMYLRSLALQGVDIPEKSKCEIEFFLHMDQSGRQLLRFDDAYLPVGLWGHVLAKCGSNVSVLYYLLEEQPSLVPSFQTPKGEQDESKRTNENATPSKKRQVLFAESGTSRLVKNKQSYGV